MSEKEPHIKSRAILLLLWGGRGSNYRLLQLRDTLFNETDEHHDMGIEQVNTLYAED